MSFLTPNFIKDSSNGFNNTLYGGFFTTTFEKVINILKKTEKCLLGYSEKLLSQEILYVINKIETNSLYSYNIEKEINKNLDKEDEMKSIYESLYEYSENKRTYENFNNILNPPRRENKVRFKTFQENKKKKNSNIMFAPSDSNINDLDAIPQESLLDIMESKISINNNATRNLNEDDNKIQKRGNNKPKDQNEFSKELQDRLKFPSISTQSMNPYSCVANNELINNTQELIKDKSFNIHTFYKENSNNPFLVLAYAAFSNFNLIDIFEDDKIKFYNFIDKVRSGYLKVPYHNEKHGIDVCVSIHSFIYHAENFKIKMKVNDLDIMTLMLAAICHDFAHPGYNNNFHINSLSSYAIIYNDKSVLENYHSAETMKILLQEGCNFLESLDKASFKKFRKLFVESILATDMTFHAKLNTLVKNRLTNNSITKGNNIENFIPEDDGMYDAHQDLFNFLLHIADISHNTKKFEISYEWVMQLSEEFWTQGDTEKSMNLPISFLCDRDTSDIPKSQIGFMSFIIAPSFEILQDMFPNLSYLNDNIAENIKNWKALSEKKEVKEVIVHQEDSSKKRKSSIKIEASTPIAKNQPILNFSIHFASINVDGDDESVYD